MVHELAEKQRVTTKQKEVGLQRDEAGIRTKQVGDDIAHDKRRPGHGRLILLRNLPLHGAKVDTPGRVPCEGFREEVKQLGKVVSGKHAAEGSLQHTEIRRRTASRRDESLRVAVLAERRTSSRESGGR